MHIPAQNSKANVLDSLPRFKITLRGNLNKHSNFQRALTGARNETPRAGSSFASSFASLPTGHPRAGGGGILRNEFSANHGMRGLPWRAGSEMSAGRRRVWTP